jgi:hypothetical protein
MVTTVEWVSAGSSGAGERQSEVWRLILDRVFADAALSEVGALRVIMPEGLFPECVDARRELAQAAPGGTRTAVAWLVARQDGAVSADKVYVLRTLWHWGQAQLRGQERQTGWTPRERWFIYPWDTWLLGVAMRVFRRLGWPEAEDRALFRIRSRLVSASPTWCAYVLTMYECGG